MRGEWGEGKKKWKVGNVEIGKRKQGRIEKNEAEDWMTKAGALDFNQTRNNNQAAAQVRR